MLARIGPGAVPLLVELLGDHETSVSSGASFALGEIGEAALPCLRWALFVGNSRMRSYALKALTRMKHHVERRADLLDIVAMVLAEDANSIVKQDAITVLRGMNAPVAVEALRRVLTAPVGSDITMLATNALQELDTSESRRALDDAKRAKPAAANRPPREQSIAVPHVAAAPTRVPRVFLSYAREDVAAMEEYRRRLTLSGFDIWADSQKLVAGENWENRLDHALHSSDFVVALLSRHTWDGFQRTEVEQAFAHSGASPDIPFLIPLALSWQEWTEESDDWPFDLRDVHVLVARGVDTGWPQLYSSLAQATHLRGLSLPQRLRSEPRELHERDVWRITFEKDFFSLERNPNGRPLGEEWDLVLNDLCAHDRATDLIWIRWPPMSCDYLTGIGLPQQVREQLLPLRGLDLRLPTLEEAMGLMTPEVNREDAHLPRLLSGHAHMMTCDRAAVPPWEKDMRGLMWVADFRSTEVQPVPFESEWPVWLVASA